MHRYILKLEKCNYLIDETVMQTRKFLPNAWVLETNKFDWNCDK